MADSDATSASEDKKAKAAKSSEPAGPKVGDTIPYAHSQHGCMQVKAVNADGTVDLGYDGSGEVLVSGYKPAV